MNVNIDFYICARRKTDRNPRFGSNRDFNHRESSMNRWRRRYILWGTKVESAEISDSSPIRSGFDPNLNKAAGIGKIVILYK